MYGTFCDKEKGVRNWVYVSYENDHSQTDEKRQ